MDRRPSESGGSRGSPAEHPKDLAALARLGLNVGDVQDVVATALGGQSVTNTVEGRERYTVNVRYPRAFRSDPKTIANEVQVPLSTGGTVPLGEVAKVELTRGPTSIRAANARYLCARVRSDQLIPPRRHAATGVLSYPRQQPHLVSSCWRAQAALGGPGPA